MTVTAILAILRIGWDILATVIVAILLTLFARAIWRMP
jgi:hypothetical protein